MRHDLAKTKGAGQRIRNRRKQRGLTLKAVAEFIGVTRAAVSQWEHGDTSMTAENLLKLALVLRSSPFELMGINGDAAGHPTLDVSRLSAALETLESFQTRKKLHITSRVKAKILSYLCEDENHVPNDRELIRLIDLAK